MTDTTPPARRLALLLVRVWFAADLVVALFPPLHWAASGAAPLGGVPRALVYLVASAAFIAASVVAAYRLDPTAAATAEER